MSVCPSVLSFCLPGLLCICRYATCLFAIPIVFLSFLFSPFCLSVQLSVSVSTCLSACPPACLCIIYLFIYCLSCLFGVLCWLEAQLPSFTVKCWADWKGRFSNGAALPLIFCLSLGVRLIYHAPSPADIQIHFDWRLDRMTPTTSNIETPLQRLHTHSLSHTHKHRQSNVMLCILAARYTVDMNMPIPPTHFHLHLKTCTCIHKLTHKLAQIPSLSRVMNSVFCTLVCKCCIEFIEQCGQTAALLLFLHPTNSIIC